MLSTQEQGGEVPPTAPENPVACPGAVLTAWRQDIQTNSPRIVVTLLEPEAEMAPLEQALLAAFFTKTWWRHAQAHLPLGNPAGMDAGLQQVKKLLYDELVTRGYFSSQRSDTRVWWRYAGVTL